jgi:hypothetical protein
MARSRGSFPDFNHPEICSGVHLSATYKGQRADGWMRDIAARESADSLRLTRETRYRFAVSQQKCDHLPLEKFDCLARALRFDLTRRRTRLLRRPLKVSFVVRGLGACRKLSRRTS